MDKENNKIIPFKTIDKIADKLRDVLNSSDNVLLYAYNGTGKTRLSMAFKNKGKKYNPQNEAFRKNKTKRSIS